MSRKYRRIRIATIILGIIAAAAFGLAVFGAVKEREMRLRLETEMNRVEQMLEEQKTMLAELQEETQEEVEVYLPQRLYVAVGRTLELYNSQVAFSGKREDYYFNWVCDIGKSLERKFQVTGEDSFVGEHILHLTVYDRHLEAVHEQDVVLEVVKDEIDRPMRILNIGDSLSDSTPWYGEVTALSGGKITFVGTRGSKEAMHEGRSGFSICDYLTETDYPYAQEGVHPFYNPAAGSFDFSYYKEKTGVSPDAVQIFLGKNGMSLDPVPGIEWLTEIVENIRTCDPDLPIYLVQTVYMGDQNGIGNETDSKGASALNGWWKLEEDQKVFLWTKAMEAAFGETDGIYLIPAALTFDSEYNYTAAIQNVNSRSSRTEAVLMEGMHPNAEGYLQLADGFFSVYCGTWK